MSVEERASLRPLEGRLNLRSAAPRCAPKSSPSSMDIYDSRRLIFCQLRSNFLPAKWSEPK
jgi:hypothetical protein